MIHIFVCMDQSDDPLTNSICLNLLDQFGDVITAFRSPLDIDQVTIASSIDELLALSKTSTSKWGLFFKYGSHITASFMRNVWRSLTTVDQDTAVIGHVLDRGERYYELHDQAFIVNLEKFRTTSGVWHKPTPGIKPVIERSSENYHDDYTPKWARIGEGMVNVTNPAPGADLVAFGMANGGCRPFNNKERHSRFFVYPDQAFYYNIEKVERKISEAQTKFYLMNTDRPVWEFTRGYERVSRIVVPASGFMPFELARESDLADDFKFVLFDCSTVAQSLYRYMLDDWDGRHPRDILAKSISGPRAVVVDGDLDTLWAGMMDRFGGTSEWLSFFNAYRHRYHLHNLDIMTGYGRADFVDTFRGHKQVIYSLSNIYWYEPTSILRPHYVRSDNLNRHLSHLRDTIPDAFVYYSMPNRFYHGLVRDTIPHEALDYPWRQPGQSMEGISHLF